MKDLEAETRRRLSRLEHLSGFARPVEPQLGIARAAATANAAATAPAMPAPESELNHRQVTFLRELSNDQLVDVHVYRKRFRVSEITACRDLAALARGHYLKRIGKARATRYARNQATESPVIPGAPAPQ